MCSPEIANKAGATATEKEVLVEEEKFKAICYVKRGDPNRYGSLITELEHRAHLGKDEYPEQLSTAFDVMVCRSGVITNTRRGGRGQGYGGRFGRSGGRGGIQFSQAG